MLLFGIPVLESIEDAAERSIQMAELEMEIRIQSFHDYHQQEERHSKKQIQKQTSHRKD